MVYRMLPSKTRAMDRRENILLHHRQFARILAIAITSLCLTLVISPVRGQQPLLPTLELPALNRLVSPPAASAEVAIGEVRLDGNRLFSVAAPAVQNQPNASNDNSPIRERVRRIETILNQIASSDIDPNQIEVTAEREPTTGLPILVLQTGAATRSTRYIMTVTNLDAQLQAEEPQQRAEQLAQILENALKQARRERQPQVLVQRSQQAALILGAVVVISWLLSRVQRQLKAQQHRISSEFPAPSEQASPNTLNLDDTAAINAVQTQMTRRQQLILNEVRRRFLQLLQIGIWGGGSFMILDLFPQTRWLQPLVLSGPLKVLAIVLGVYVAIRISDVLIDRFFAILTTQEAIPAGNSQRLALRVSTFSRVLRSVVGFLLISTGILSVLSILGVELGPVLAGAGILGLAISFASQNLIKDVINGFLILLEDQYAVGDVIEVSKVTGLVESMNLRITQLRNAEGRLITIPNSAITIVENLSKDWSRVDLTITIAHDANVDQAIALIKQVGETMHQSPLWDERILEDPEVLGVDDLNNTGILIRVWIKTLPLEQWNVAREFRRRLKLALDEAGIAIGVPQQSLWFHSSLGLNQQAFQEKP
jgi:small conductance mechanosensitive channel